MIGQQGNSIFIHRV